MDHDLERGRASYAKQAWNDAYGSLSRADRASPLDAGDLELLATAAYLVGRDDEYLSILERAYHAHVGAAADLRAARCAFWLGLTCLFRGASGHAAAWFARTERLIDGCDCAEQGYLLVPVAERHLGGGRCDAAYSVAGDAAAIGERFADVDLAAAARHIQGRALIGEGRLQAGLVLLDEAMLAVTSGELSPIMTGLIYCSVIDACQQAYAVDRAREWTAALARWCDKQPEMMAFTETCLVHRAEIMQLQGAWPEAIEEARRACKRFALGLRPQAPIGAFYMEAEVHRLRGEFVAAEQAYRRASEGGWDPQPGLALLWLTRGRASAADAAMRRALSATTGRLARSKLLPAYVEITLAGGDRAAARAASRELEEIAQQLGSDVLVALAAQARGAVELAHGDGRAALKSLYRARELWQQIDAPYELARTRELIGLTCRALGDRDGGDLELEAARAAFARLGAGPDRARVEALMQPDAGSASGLTPRELQVLRLLATGRTNRTIAAELSLSEKTVDRHVSNIFTKLEVASRAAATAYAYEHRLI